MVGQTVLPPVPCPSTRPMTRGAVPPSRRIPRGTTVKRYTGSRDSPPLSMCAEKHCGDLVSNNVQWHTIRRAELRRFRHLVEFATLFNVSTIFLCARIVGGGGSWVLTTCFSFRTWGVIACQRSILPQREGCREHRTGYFRKTSGRESFAENILLEFAQRWHPLRCRENDSDSRSHARANSKLL